MRALIPLAERAVRRRLACLESGQLELRDGNRTARFGPPSRAPIRCAVTDGRFYPAVAFGGHLGAAEAYAKGWWTTDDLTGVIRLFAANRRVLADLETGWARLLRPVRALVHALHRNTRPGSRRNILAHYDLSNEFFRLFLDDTMTYSCGIFESPECSLRDASIAKYDRLCRRLDLGPDDRVLEIGTGWGGFAIHAATHYGCRVTTTTISEQQYQLASARIAAAGQSSRVTLLKQDYRDLRGQFDKLVSIEMIEAVGHQYYQGFFEICAGLLAPEGWMAIQAITVEDRYYDAARREVDFIKRYIFPGSCIPSVAALFHAARHTDLRLMHAEDFGLHYAETLRRWRENFDRHEDQIDALGFGAELRRLWRFYFCYCEGGFLEGTLGDIQIVWAKSAAAPRRGLWPASAAASELEAVG